MKAIIVCLGRKVEEMAAKSSWLKSESVAAMFRSIDDCRAIAAQIEQGRSETPLSRHFGNTSVGPDGLTPILSVLVLALEPLNVPTVLSWIFKQSLPGEMIKFSRECDLLQVHVVQTKEMLLTKKTLAFDSWQDALETLSNKPLPSTIRVEKPRVMDVAIAHNKMRECILLIPPSLETLQQLPVLASFALSTVDVIIVAGGESTALDIPALELLEQMISVVPERYSLICDRLNDGPDPKWKAVVGARQSFRYSESDESLPPLLAELDESKRDFHQAVLYRRQLQQLYSSLSLLEDELAGRQRKLEAAKRKLQIRISGISERQRAISKARESLTAARAEIDKQFGKLGAAFEENFARRTMPASIFLTRLASWLDRLDAVDLTQTISGQRLQFGIAEDTVRRGKELVKDVLQHDCDEDLNDLPIILRKSVESISDILARRTDNLARLTMPQPKLSESVYSVRLSVISLESLERYRSEDHRHGIFDLISYGRRPVVVAGMLLSMFGAVFGLSADSRFFWAPLMACLFLASLGWAWYEMRQARRHRLEQEVLRMRELFRTELIRAYSEAIEKLRKILLQYCRNFFQQELVRDINEMIKRFENDQNQTIHEQQLELQDKQKLLDQRQNTLRIQKQNLLQARQATNQARQLLEKELEAYFRDLGSSR